MTTTAAAPPPRTMSIELAPAAGCSSLGLSPLPGEGGVPSFPLSPPPPAGLGARPAGEGGGVIGPWELGAGTGPVPLLGDDGDGDCGGGGGGGGDGVPGDGVGEGGSISAAPCE